MPHATQPEPLGAPRWLEPPTRSTEHFTAQALAFDKPTENSLDSVSDRDFAIEFCAFASILMTHMSRMSEELVLWTSAQFQFINLPDRFCTGSSIMPQKKNPDVPELVRGKTGRVNGHLISLLTLMKSQPLAYNKDNQEDKEPLFDTVDTVRDCLRAFADMIPAIESRKDMMYEAPAAAFQPPLIWRIIWSAKALPLEIPTRLSASRLPMGWPKIRISRRCRCRSYSNFPLKSVLMYLMYLTLEGSVAARDHLGGTAPAQVVAAAGRAKARLMRALRTVLSGA